jgi:hypothetical protein
MKLFVKLLITIAIIAVLLPFTLLKDKTGKTLMSFSDLDFSEISMPDMSSLSDTAKQAATSQSLAGKDIFYKWYDDKGNLHFTTEPPPPGVEYVVKGFDPNTNVIQAVKVKPNVDAKDAKVASPKQAAKVEEINNPYSQDSIKKLFEDAQNIEKLLNDRAQKYESANTQ